MKLTPLPVTITYHLTEVPVLWEALEGMKKLMPFAKIGYLEDIQGYFITVPVTAQILVNEKDIEKVFDTTWT